ncbi:MAG: DegT/DnrJ/EryC1/StrS family aminotransferase [Pseudomonadota bacterium]
MPGFEWFGDEERKEVMDVLETGVLMRYGFDGARKGHWKARAFEQELAGALGVGYCHLCASGTAALGVALAACGVGAGSEVIVPPFTFVATIEAVIFAGAVPVFADVDDTLCLDPTAIAAAVTPRTRAVIPVHMCGSMARIDDIAAVCRRHELVLIEDACQAVGGTYHGKALGSFGQMGCFSFDPVKTITCGEGGGIITNDAALYDTAHAFADHGHDHIGSDRGLEKHPILGLNLRISELNAAVGLAQLRKLPRILEVQRAHKNALKTRLENIPGLAFRHVPDPAGDTATFLSLLFPDEDTARRAGKALGAAGVDGCFYWYDNNWHYHRRWDHFKTLSAAAPVPLSLMVDRPDYGALDLPRSDGIIGRTLSMQIKLAWRPEEIEKRGAAMEKVLRSL